MTHAVVEPCIQCKHTDCVDVCPVDCFHGGMDFLACVPECPVEAIYPEDELAVSWAEYLDLNERLSKVWPVIAAKMGALEDAGDWGSVESKRERLSEEPGPGTED